MKPSIIVIGGPTASGKSKLAAEVARETNGVVLSADSVSVYQGCDIVAAKPTVAEQLEIPHKFLSLFSPDAQFDVAQFVSRATEQIKELHHAGRTPIICGGTGLYIRSLLCGLVETPEIKEAVRLEVSERERTFLVDGDEARRIRMHLWLQSVDPDRAAVLSPRDVVRVRRALLVTLSSGQRLSQLQLSHGNRDQQWRALVVCLLPNREVLYRRINNRVEEMLQGGGIEEVERLREQFADDAPALKGIGYRHIAAFLRGEIEREVMVESLKQDTRRLAKRQYTWWRNEPGKLGWADISSQLQDLEICGPRSSVVTRFLNAEVPFAGDYIYYLGTSEFGKINSEVNGG